MIFLDYLKKYWYLFIIIIEFAAIMGILLIKTDKKENQIQIIDEPIAVSKEIKEENTKPKTIKIDIKGAVKKPGVYEISANSIVNDVITLAGGLKSGGTTKNINLSKKLTDEMVITIYTTSELNKLNETTKEQINEPQPTCKENTIIIDKCEGSSIIESNNTQNNSQDNNQLEEETIINEPETPKNEGLISINTATKEELMTLNGIGESKAISIINYRTENGCFKSIDELKNISGIGEVLFAKIKDFITV